MSVAKSKKKPEASPAASLKALADQAAKAAGESGPAWPADKPVELVAYTAEQMMGRIEPEQYLLPGVPAEAYTLIAGALSSFKTTLLMYLLVWKASGEDVLGLESGQKIERGKSVLIVYEDTEAKVFAKLQRVVQHGCDVLKIRHGERAAQDFAGRVAKYLRLVILTGEACAGIVTRDAAGRVVRNDAFLAQLLAAVRDFAPSGALIGLDPLRLAIVGSQNDDDGADVVVHTLNHLAAEIPGSGVIIASHATKAGAKEGVNGYVEAAYGTAGSALYSQHARSNFHMGRLKAEEIRKLFSPKEVTPEQAEGELVTKLTHGRDSHKRERQAVYLLMGPGTLTPVLPRNGKDPAATMRENALAVIEAVDRLRAAGVKVSKGALETDDTLASALGNRRAVRDALGLLAENGYIEVTGGSKNTEVSVTDAGRALASGENRRESLKGAKF